MSDASGVAVLVGRLCSNGHEMTPENTKVRPSRHEGKTVSP